MCTRRVGEYKSRAEYLHRERCRGCIWVHDSTPGYPSRPFEKMALRRWGLRTANQTHKNLQCKLIFSKQLSTTRHTNIANIGRKELQLSILRKNVSQASQAVPNLLGVSIAGYINMAWGGKVTHTQSNWETKEMPLNKYHAHSFLSFQAGYYFSAACVLIGSATLSLIDLHR